MQLKIERTSYSPLSTQGRLLVDGVQACFTLEPPRRDIKPRCIPEGLYSITLRLSKKFGRIMPHVEDVPGFEAIEIHWGNWPRDTQGCLLVGRATGIDCVLDSRNAFAELYERLAKATDGITITYTNATQGETN